MDAAGPHARERVDSLVFSAVLACFVLSGFAGLLYQTAWMRQFSVVFGTSELAVATVLAAYMAGLAAGAAAAARWIRHVRRPVLVYGLLELGIAVAALLVPVALRAARGLYVLFFGGRPEIPEAGLATHSIFFLVASFLILSLPTVCMGATLPLLTRHAVRRPDQIGGRVGLLYATNTAGAVAGTLTAAFVLLPRVGLQKTVWVGVGVNLLVCVIAVRIGRGAALPRSTDRPAAERRVTTAAWVLPIMLLSGACSFVYEVLWTRLLTHVLGGSIFAFATMLAVFLTGIALGSGIASRWATTRNRSVRGLVAAQLATAVLSLATYVLLGSLIEAGLGHNVWVAGITILPSTLCIGATFPFAVRVLARDEGDAGPASARVYSWNTAGAIVGAVGAGFLLLPALGFEGTVQLAVGTNVVLAVAASLLSSRVSWPVTTAATVLAVVVLLGFDPVRPEAVVRSSPFDSGPVPGRLLYYGVGRSATVAVLERNGKMFVRSNGLNEARIAPRGSPLPTNVDHRMAALPLIARPGAESMLIIGFGGGSTAEGIPPEVKQIDVIELEPKVIAANQAVSELRWKDPLADPRVKIKLNDARSALSLTDKRYDVIVSQPSHPWTAGASHLYTLEFVRDARRHLTSEGVFVQWIDGSFIDRDLFRVLGATLLDLFPHVRVYSHVPGELLFLASGAPLLPEREWGRNGHPSDPARAYYGLLGIGDLNDVVIPLVLEHDGVVALCRGAPVNTDNRNRLATESVLDGGPARMQELESLLAAFDPLLEQDSELADTPGLDRVYIARRLAKLGFAGRARKVADSIEDPYERLLAAALVEPRIAGDALRRALALDPRDSRARFALVQPFLSDLATDRASTEIRDLAGGLTGVHAEVIQAGVHGHRNEWQRVYEAEAVLAAVPTTDLAFPLASRLRAAWRTNVPSPELQRRYAPEALQIIDLAIAFEAEPRDYLIRAAAASFADRPHALLETARSVLRILKRKSAGADTRALDDLKGTASKMLALLDPLSADGRVPQYRLEEVTAGLRTVLHAGQP